MRSVTPKQLRNLTAPERQAMAASLIPNRKCVVCRSPQRAEIEEHWLKGHSLKSVSEEYTTFSYGTILRHWSEGHPKETLGAEWASIYASRDLLERIEVLIDETQDIFVRARAGGDEKLAMQTMDRLTRLVEVMGRVTGEIKAGETNVNIHVGSEQAQRMVGASNELELAEEYERRAGLLRERWAEKQALQAKEASAFAEPQGVITDAIIVAEPQT